MAVVTVNISFQKELLADIDAEARRESRSRSELLREAARLYVLRQRRWQAVFAMGDSMAEEYALTPATVSREIAAKRRRKRVAR